MTEMVMVTMFSKGRGDNNKYGNYEIINIDNTFSAKKNYIYIYIDNTTTL